MIKRFGLTLKALLIALLTSWGVLAIYYCAPPKAGFALAAAYGLCGLLALFGLFMSGQARRASGLFILVFACVVVWWETLRPSNDRDWQPEVAVLPYATINGDLVTVHNIRNFDYRSQTDFIPAWYDKTFDISKLESLDFIAVYWMGPAIAHTFLSFGFKGGSYLAISIETRREKREGYSTIKGFFRQYELYYVVADERDVIRVRTNYRVPPEDVYIYRIKGPVANGRRLFLEYMQRINALKEKPEFYNTMTQNCTTAMWLNSRINPDHMPFSWKVLASGYAPEYLYENGRLNTTLPFSEVREHSRINDRALASGNAMDFSRRIREGLPTISNLY
jgi:hypothetical protein